MDTAILPEAELKVENQRPKIVLIDDDPDQLKVLSYRLEQQGFETFPAKDGRSGLSLVERIKPDAIIMDLGLPDSSGLDICRKITDDSRLCQIPVIIVSGRESSDVVRETRIAGASFFIRKPYDPNALLLLVRKAIDDAAEYQ